VEPVADAAGEAVRCTAACQSVRKHGPTRCRQSYYLFLALAESRVQVLVVLS
jgi:hypothetical protein